MLIGVLGKAWFKCSISWSSLAIRFGWDVQLVSWISRVLRNTVFCLMCSIQSDMILDMMYGFPV